MDFVECRAVVRFHCEHRLEIVALSEPLQVVFVPSKKGMDALLVVFRYSRIETMLQ